MAETVEQPSFDGNVWSYLGWRILGGLVTVITLGLAYPLAACWLYGYEINHTIIEGRRLKFKGSAGVLFGHYIIWWLLSIITLSLYAWIGMPVALLRWKAKNTFFADNSFNSNAQTSFSGNAQSTFVDANAKVKESVYGRSAPEFGTPEIELLNAGMEVKILETRGEWSKVRTPSNNEVWCYTSCLTKK